MTSITKIVLLVTAIVCGMSARSEAIVWAVVNAKIRHEFPAVKRISTAELAIWLQDASRPVPLLLDVRTRAEYEVSHLKNAEHVAPDASTGAVQEPKDRAIVTYCSVGYRSGGFAEKLQAVGFTNVQNLEGSIFQWANEGRPVYRGREPALQVHPYSRTWGLLLKKNLRAPLSASEGPAK